MPYITSVERIGIRKRLQQGRQGSIIRILELRFEDIPQEFRELIWKIEDLDIL